MSTTTEPTAADLREQATRDRQAADDSFDRCDTDGFVSQWAHGITAEKKDAEADLIDAGGVHQFTALYDLDGNLVPAKQIVGRYGPCWAILDGWDWSESRFTGEFVSDAKRQATYEKKGYRLGLVSAPAKVVTRGSGKGFSGLTSVHVAYVQTDFGTPVHDGTGIANTIDLF